MVEVEVEVVVEVVVLVVMVVTEQIELCLRWRCW